MRQYNTLKLVHYGAGLLQEWPQTGLELPYFSIDNAQLMYNAHPKLFRHSFWCIDNARDANKR
jgi:hypothetical protein